ncbi:hypothetical protein FZC84_19415 [Rossellomorea vietnamensis]|uniref:Uncharacterized protein n=1 Tax=Rossellomorea vietnamensis TaxID=218284 RepID=A0A5D4M744_9BACI|nr:hypothetical protein FZC84_19415 [Rossellomorea vietnamensis]
MRRDAISFLEIWLKANQGETGKTMKNFFQLFKKASIE